MKDVIEVIGIQKLDYVSRRTGKSVKGANFYYLRTGISHSIGNIPQSIFLTDDLLKDVPLRTGKYEFEAANNGRYINYVSVKAI